VVTVLEMQEDTFLQKNFEYYQEWHHWLGKADKLKRAALILYQADLPDLRLYDAAYKIALAEIGEEGRAPVRHPHPDMLPAFSLFGSALESVFKGLMVSKNPGLIGADKLSPSLKRPRSCPAGKRCRAAPQRVGNEPVGVGFGGLDLEGPLLGTDEHQVWGRLLSPARQHQST
jgi:hypothetical protein